MGKNNFEALGIFISPHGCAGSITYRGNINYPNFDSFPIPFHRCKEYYTLLHQMMNEDLIKYLDSIDADEVYR